MLSAVKDSGTVRRDVLKTAKDRGVKWIRLAFVDIFGIEKNITVPVSELERMARSIRGADLKIVSRAGHFAAFEQPDDVGRLLRDFLERNGR